MKTFHVDMRVRFFAKAENAEEAELLLWQSPILAGAPEVAPEPAEIEPEVDIELGLALGS